MLEASCVSNFKEMLQSESVIFQKEKKKKLDHYFFPNIQNKKTCNVRLLCIVLGYFFLSLSLHLGALAVEQQPFELSTASEQEHTITSVLMQSVILPCKAILLIMEPERVSDRKDENLALMKMILLGYVV